MSKIFKDFNYNWLARELELNLPQELDFEHEAANLDKCRHLLNDMIESGDLALPHVAKASKRVLVMTFEEVIFFTMIWFSGMKASVPKMLCVFVCLNAAFNILKINHIRALTSLITRR